MVRHSRLSGRDIAVVLGCIVFAFMTLGAVGEGGRRRAKETVCQSNLRLWHGIFQEYLEENDGKFFTGVNDMGYWWPFQLAGEYQDWKRNRAWFCPMAVTPTYSKSGVPPISSAFRAWGIESPQTTGTPSSIAWRGTTYKLNPNGLNGSYALNGYTVSAVHQYEGGVPANQGWPDLKDVSHPDQVPLFFDALRFDLWPQHTDAPSTSEVVLGNSVSMARCCINRHNGTVNCLFVDGSVRKVGLKELWTLKWSRSFSTNGPWTTAGGVRPEHWPEWMRNFKDY